MKKEKVEVDLFEKGDKVISPKGFAVIEEDEKFEKNFGKVLIRWTDCLRPELNGKKEEHYVSSLALVNENE